MSSTWHLSRGDSPSVLSDRVYSIRRLNKMESQRLGSQLKFLNSEIANSKYQISQEQKALRKELAQIQEVKDNPPIGLERRKLLHQKSSKESQTCRDHLSLEPQVMPSRCRSQSTGHPPTQGSQRPLQSRFRSLSTGHPPMQGSQLLSLTKRQRSTSTTCPPLRLGVEEPSGAFRGRKESGILHDVNNNTPAQEVRSDARRNQKVRSLSTGTPPQIPEWVKDTNDAVAAHKKLDDSEVPIFTKVQGWQNSNWCQDSVIREFGKSPNWAWKEKGLQALSTVKMNGSLRLLPPDFRPKQGVGSPAPRKHASTRKERRSYSTNSTPIISEGRVVGLCDKTVPQTVDTASQRRICFSTSCTSQATGVPNDDAIRKREFQGLPAPSNRRRRSLSTSQCPPAIVEGSRTMETHRNNGGQDSTREPFKDDDKEKILSRETEETSFSHKQVESDEEFRESQNSYNNNDRYEFISEVEGRGGMGHEDGISLQQL